jgi:hypothetical protein
LEYIKQEFSSYSNPHVLEERKTKFFNRRLFSEKEAFQCNHDKVRTILQEAFITIKPVQIGENDVVVHVRSGDLFSSKHPHP